MIGGLPMQALQQIRQRLARFQEDTSGSVAVLYAGSAILVLGFMALAVDGARAHLLRSQLHYAVDSAAIAIGKEMKYLDDDQLLLLAESYVTTNVSPRLLGIEGQFEVGDLTVEVLPGATDDLKEIRATAVMNTTLLGIVDGDSTVSLQRSAVVRREIKGLEMALSLDVTGSMDWGSGTEGVSRIEALQSASTDLLDIIFGDNPTHPRVWISVVPFTRSVQAQTDVSWVQQSTMDPPKPHAGYNEQYKWNPQPDFAGGDSFCYGERSTQSLAEGDTPPSSEGTKFPAWYEYDFTYRGYWNQKYRYFVKAWGGYRCPDVAHDILPLTNVRSEIQAHIDGLVPFGGTATDRGAVWGWRTISERWRGYWDTADSAHPLDNDAPLNNKVLVLMTDGQNSYQSSSDPALARICANAKANGITIVSINFAMSENLYDLYRNCASSPSLFFPAATGEQLRSTFHAIALQLSVLRLVQ